MSAKLTLLSLSLAKSLVTSEPVEAVSNTAVLTVSSPGVMVGAKKLRMIFTITSAVFIWAGTPPS